ncbi:hypothetical protein [Brevibacillus laterosporus]|uniref:hypothetical protein n=1 Tax=Brevibacillus laterosporus TaxID=1465 RepID=UPI002E1FB479|nr:hypothetical protein [Brevibacillus laterosporus]MED1667271.1 hypothetical protein [Brevibacillus laterosporus]MED1719661.1 hypothetical protein [Brevibacillus laterosporus]
MLKRFKEIVDTLDKRDKANALKTMKTLSKEKVEIKELNKTYWVSEWSWTPISDGIYSCQEHLQQIKIFGELLTYYTGTNYRVYFPWDVYETKEECDEACRLKNSFGYDWHIAYYEFIKQHTTD